MHKELTEVFVASLGLRRNDAQPGSPTQLQTITCTSSLLHTRHSKINEMPTRHRSGCPEGARNPGRREVSLRFPGLSDSPGLTTLVRVDGLFLTLWPAVAIVKDAASLPVFLLTISGPISKAAGPSSKLFRRRRLNTP
jgi:hypothetical protein